MDLQFLKLILLEFSSLPALSIFFSQPLIFQARRRKRKKWYLYESAFFFPLFVFLPTPHRVFLPAYPTARRSYNDNPATRDRNEGKKWLAFKAFSTDATLASNERPLASFSLPFYRILMNLKYDSIFIWHNFLEEVIFLKMATIRNYHIFSKEYFVFKE